MLRIKAFEETHNVLLFFPPESEEQSSILLVYDPNSPSASPSPVEKAKHLDEVEKEVLKFAKEAADVKSQTLSVEKKWHDAVVGQGGTTLNAYVNSRAVAPTHILNYAHFLVSLAKNRDFRLKWARKWVTSRQRTLYSCEASVPKSTVP
jgi:hypothetical protein